MAHIDWKDTSILNRAREHEREAIDLIRSMVEVESPSDNPAALEQFAGWFTRMVALDFGASVEVAPSDHLLCRFALGNPDPDEGQILVLGHYDTVWPCGTLVRMPFRQEAGRLWGPGVLDMKGGLAMLLMAIRLLRELDVPVRTNVLLQVNADEEVGSRTSRDLTELNAKESRAVLVVEPGSGLAGKLKTARKGVGEYKLRVEGRAAHAGVDFQSGASAILELSRQLLAISEFTDVERGITVNPGVISGGTRGNVVAAEALASIDIRVARMSDAATLRARFEALTPMDTRCSLTMTGGMNRPPMERSEGIARLFEIARELGHEIGVELEESSTGGGSDGNFTAAMGVPTLDGIGAVGEGAHAANESILISRIPDRIAMLAMLLASL